MNRELKFRVVGALIAFIVYAFGFYLSGSPFERGDRLVFVYIFGLLAMALGQRIAAVIECEMK